MLKTGLQHRRLPKAVPTWCAAILLGLSACATQPGTVFRDFELSDDKSITTGARQRAVLNITPGDGSRPGLINPERIVCAEPSPDVASAIAQSFGFGVSVLQFGAGSASAAQAENVAQLAERTASIQLLRDQMYRACEAYANGAITGTTYNLIMSKNNDAMVTMMLGETAGGRFGRSLAAIGTSASGEAEASIIALKELQDALDAADKEVEDAQKEEDDAEEKLADKKDAAEKDEDASDEEKADNDAEVDEAEAELAAAQEKTRQKEEDRAETKAQARAEVTRLIGAGSISNNIGASQAQALTRMQTSFLDEDFVDEYVSACIIELGLAPHSDLLNVERLHEINSQNVTQIMGGFRNTIRAAESLEDIGAIAKTYADAAESFSEVIRNLAANERTSRLAAHCDQLLGRFILKAHQTEADLERERIRLKAQVAAGDGVAVKKDFLKAFNKSMELCDKQNEPYKAKCISAATTITETGQILEFGQATPIAMPVPAEILPLTDYKRAAAAAVKFRELVTKLRAKQVPATVAKAENQDARDNLAEQRQKLDQTVTKLSSDADAAIDTPPATTLGKAVADFQDERDELVTTLNLAEGEPVQKVARRALEHHDAKAELKQHEFQTLLKRLLTANGAIERHLAAIDALEKKDR